MKVRVLLFAGLREKIGQSEVGLELAEGSRVSDLKKSLSLEDSAWQALAFAVNQAYSKADSILKDGDEVALIPPVSGG